MNPRIDELARRVLSKPEAQRDVYLDGACGGDEELKAEVLGAMRAITRAEAQAAAAAAAAAAGAETIVANVGGAANGTMMEGPGSTIGAYKILQLIGEGGFGYVYMAQQSHPVKRKVALKIVKPGMDSKQVVGRFESERHALALMDHPNIARVYDAGTTQTGRPYFVMELVKGVSITTYCDDAKLTTRERIELFIDVCHAVQHAHYKGIVHRDLKPSNVLVTLHDGKPVVKVIDFGIAKAMNQDLTEGTVFTEFRQIVGTPEYMSPEQAAMSGLDVDSRTDIYSLGVLLYELMSGMTPFDSAVLRSAGLAEIQRMIKEDEPARPSTRVARSRGLGITKGATKGATVGATGATKSTTIEDVARVRQTDPGSLKRLLAGDLDWVCMKAMEKDRRRRYETASALADDLQRHLNHEPILARPPSTAYRLQKFARRNRAAVGAGGGVLFALLLTMAALGYGFLAVRQERDKTAERETETRAKMLLSGMNAVRKYTADHVRPTLVTASSGGERTTPDYHAFFAKEMVPGYSARQVFMNFRDAQGADAADGAYKGFVYKEASPNPTNKEDLADAFEAELVKMFEADRSVKEKSGIRDVGGTRTYYIARPMEIKDAKCLDCHTTVESAPAKQVELYGTNGWSGGYGWKMNDIVAAQVVYVPVTEAFRAEPGVGTKVIVGVVVASLVGGFVSLLVLLRRA